MKTGIIFAGFLASVIFISGCEARRDIFGDYEYVNSEHTCKITIRSDFTFIQNIRITTTGVESNMVGKWKRTEAAIEFNPFMYSVDMNSGRILGNPVRTSSAIGVIKGDFIILNEDSKFWFRAIKRK